MITEVERDENCSFHPRYNAIASQLIRMQSVIHFMFDCVLLQMDVEICLYDIHWLVGSPIY